MIHATDSRIQTRSAPREHAPSDSHAVPAHLREFDPSQRPRTISESRGTADRRARAAPAACDLRARSIAPAAEPSGPSLPGRPFAGLTAMEELPRRRSPRDRSPVASRGIPPVPAFDLDTRPWPSPYLQGSPRTHRADGHREPMACSKDQAPRLSDCRVSAVFTIGIAGLMPLDGPPARPRSTRRAARMNKENGQ